jgi:hypothetical protein
MLHIDQKKPQTPPSQSRCTAEVYALLKLKPGERVFVESSLKLIEPVLAFNNALAQRKAEELDALEEMENFFNAYDEAKVTPNTDAATIDSLIKSGNNANNAISNMINKTQTLLNMPLPTSEAHLKLYADTALKGVKDPKDIQPRTLEAKNDHQLGILRAHLVKLALKDENQPINEVLKALKEDKPDLEARLANLNAIASKQKAALTPAAPAPASPALGHP